MVEQKPPDTPEKGRVPETIAAEIDLFVNQIDGLADTLPLAVLAIQKAHHASSAELHKFLTELGNPVPGESGKVTYTLHGGTYLHYRRLSSRAQKTATAGQLVPRSILVSLVSQFDAFLGRLIRHLFNAKPEIINCSTNVLTFSQLKEFGSVENAREYIVDKEVESVLRKSHTEQFDWLENKFGLPLRVGLAVWPVFIEVTERRNLFVHANGVVSHQYLEVCKRSSCDLQPGVSQGGSLPVTRDYFARAHECIFEVGIKLAQVLWRKLLPEDLTSADQSLVRISYELLVEGRYRLARVLLDFSTEVLKRYADEGYRLTFVVNRAQAYKWLGHEERVRTIVGEEDWSATSLKFKLARSVLLDDFDAAAELLVTIGQNGEIDKHSYREWPLFREARKSEKFAAAFEQVFGEPLNTISVNREADAPLKQIIQ